MGLQGPQRVVIIDDHDSERMQLRRAFGGSGIAVAGSREALDAESGDVVLLVAEGMLGTVADCGHSAPVVVLCDGDSALELSDAIERGACGFVRRTAPTRDIVDAVRAAASGRRLLVPPVGRPQAAVSQPASMSSFSATAGEPSGCW